MPRKGGVPQNLKPFKKGWKGGPGRPPGKHPRYWLKAFKETLMGDLQAMQGKINKMTLNQVSALSAAMRSTKTGSDYELFIKLIYGNSNNENPNRNISTENELRLCSEAELKEIQFILEGARKRNETQNSES